MSDFTYFLLKNRELPIISAADIASIKPPYVHFHRQYPEFILYYILSGELFLKEGSESYHLQENDFILLDPARSHYGQKSSTCQFYYIHFSLPCLVEVSLPKAHLIDLLEQTQFNKSVSDNSILPSSKELSNLYIPKHHTLSASAPISQAHILLNKVLESFSSHEFHHQMEASCLLYELLITLSRDFSYHLIYDIRSNHNVLNQTIPLLLNFLNQCYAQNISSSLIEAKYSCNFDHLNRQFKKATGQTIFSYLNGLRIEKARQLLSTGFYTLTDIADRTGFRDVYYFSKVFKKYTGISPGKYSKSFL